MSTYSDLSIISIKRTLSEETYKNEVLLSPIETPVYSTSESTILIGKNTIASPDWKIQTENDYTQPDTVDITFAIGAPFGVQIDRVTGAYVLLSSTGQLVPSYTLLASKIVAVTYTTGDTKLPTRFGAIIPKARNRTTWKSNEDLPHSNHNCLKAFPSMYIVPVKQMRQNELLPAFSIVNEGVDITTLYLWERYILELQDSTRNFA